MINHKSSIINRKWQLAFTLIELLVVILVIFSVGTLITSVLFSALRGANKTNTIDLVRRNGNSAITQMSRMIRYSQSFDGVSIDGTPGSYTTSCVLPIVAVSVPFNIAKLPESGLQSFWANIIPNYLRQLRKDAKQVSLPVFLALEQYFRQFFEKIKIQPVYAAAPTFNAASSAPICSPCSSISWSHTVGTSGTNRMLIVGVATDAGVDVTNVTYNGVALTPVAEAINSGQVRVEMWRLLSPATGTKTISVTTASLTEIAAGATSWFGVDQTTPTGSAANAVGNSTIPSVNASSATGEIVVDMVGSNNGNDLFPGSGQTSLWFTAQAGFISGVSSSEPGASTVTMSYDQPASGEWAIAAVSLKPAPAPTPTPTPTPPLTISGNVFTDTNGNMAKDVGESNYVGTNNLTLRTGSCTGTLIGTRSSVSTTPGYSFSNLINGTTYYIVFTRPSGYNITIPNPATLCSGSNYYVTRLVSGADVSQDWGIQLIPPTPTPTLTPTPTPTPIPTRFYLPSSGDPVPVLSPAFDAGWEDLSIGARLRTQTIKSSTAMTTVPFDDANVSNKDVLFRQYISDPIAAVIITNPAVRFQIRAKEGFTSANAFVALHIRVVQPDGNLRGTILSVARDTLELSQPSLMNRSFTASPTVTVNAIDGDRIVIEIGTGGTPSSGGHDSDLRIGDAVATDLPENDTTTTDLNPWVELSTAITFMPPTYNISGNVFIDDGAGGGIENNGVKEVGELNYTADAITITSSPTGTVTIPCSPSCTGAYNVSGVPNGSYDITLTTIPSGYIISNGGVNPNTNPRTVVVLDADAVNNNFGIIVAPTPTPTSTPTPTPSGPTPTSTPGPSPTPTPTPNPYHYAQVTGFDGGKTIFKCDTSGIASNSASLIDTSLVDVSSCYFTCSQNNIFSPPNIGINFSLTQKGNPQFFENKASATFQTSVSVRNY